jgi:rubrerythrin
MMANYSLEKGEKIVATKGNEKIEITCGNCGRKITDWKNIFEGKETSYECPFCGENGYAYNSNTKIKR